MGAAGRPRAALRLPVVQRAPAADLGNRPTLRSARGRGRDRAKLFLPSHIQRRRVLRRQDLQSLYRVGLDRNVHRRIQRRQFRSRTAWLRRRRLYGGSADQWPTDPDCEDTKGNAEMGRRVEEGGGEELLEQL